MRPIAPSRRSATGSARSPSMPGCTRDATPRVTRGAPRGADAPAASPRMSAIAWGTRARIARRQSAAPFGRARQRDDERLLRARPRPAARDRPPEKPRAVSTRIFSASPGTSKSIASRTPSGVRSRGATPVPPVRRIRSASPASAAHADGARDLLGLVGQDLARDDAVLDPGLRQGLLAGGPALVLARAGGDAVGDRQDRDPDHA